MYFSAIVAHDKNKLIGGNNKLLWHIPEDLKRFKKITTNSVVVMGRKTYESIGKPLPNRINVILTKNKNYKVDGCIVLNSVDEIIMEFKNTPEVFIIGGGEIYKQFLSYIDRIYVTLVEGNYEGDSYFPEYSEYDWKCFYEEKGEGFTYKTYIRKK